MNITTKFGRRLTLPTSSSKMLSIKSASRRKWLAGLAFGALIAMNAPTSAQAQIPRKISYQGLIQDKGVPMNGTVTLKINYYNVGSSAPIFSETFGQVPIVNGIYNIELGSIGGGFPLTMNFNQPIEIGIQVNNSNELTPRVPFDAAPYALNAATLNGIPSSPTPLAGAIFPLPLDDNGKIASSLLPIIVGGQNITIGRDSLNRIVINGATGSTSGIRSITAGSGLQGGGSSGDITLAIAPGGIQGSQIAPGTITGRNLDPNIAGIGLYQDQVGNLNVGVDPNTFQFTNNKLTLRNGIPIIGGAGSFTTLTSSDNSNIGAGTAATSNSFGTGGNAAGVTNIIGSTGAGSTTRINGGVFFTGSIDAGGGRITNIGAPIGANDVATRAYADSSAARNSVMGGDVTGTSGNNMLSATNPGVGNREIAGINNGTTQINGSRVNSTFGTQPVTGGSATFTTLNVTGNTALATMPGSITAIGNTTGTTGFTGPVTFNGTFDGGGNRLMNIGTPINPNDAATRAYADSSSSRPMVLGGDLSGTTGNAQINPNAAGIGNRMITGLNNGTTSINGARITPNFGTQTLTAGPASFTTLTSSGLTTLATGGANVGIGTTTPNALLDVLGNTTTPQLARFYNTGAGGSTVRVVGGAGALTALEFTDATQYVSSVTSTAGNGLMFNVAPSGTGSEATLNGATKLAIDRLGNVLFTANSVAFSGSRLQNVGTPTVGTDAANKAYVDGAVSGSTLVGDVNGTPGNNTLGTTTATGNREVTGINNATSQINGSQVNPNFGSQAVTGGAGSFTTLSSTGTTTLASGAGAITTIGNTTGMTNVLGGLALNNSTMNYPTEVNGAYVQSFGSGANRSTGVTAEATATGVTSGTRPASNAVLGVAKYTGALNTTNQIVGVAGKAEPGAGVTAVGVVGEASTANALPNNGVVGFALNSTSSNVGVLGAATATQAQLAALAATPTQAGVYAYNPTLTANNYALQTNGNVSFGNARLQNVANPTAATDAATKSYVDSTSTSASMLAGDVGGTSGNNTLGTTMATGNREITGINNGTSQINGSRVNPNFGTQAVTGGAGSFTTLTSSGLTTLATGGSNVGIGTTTPNALLDVISNNAGQQLARFYNTGTGSSVVRVVGGAGSLTGLEFTDATQYVSSVTSTAGNGLMFNVAPAGTGTEAALNAATKLAIDRLGNVVFTANSVSFSGSRLQNVATPTAATDAANKAYVDASSTSASALAGDVTGTTGNNALATTSATGNREIAGINNGTTQIDGARVNAWSLTGNAGTNPATNFLGTTDAQPLSIRTNNVQREIYRADGTIAFGNTAPAYTSNVVEVDMQNVGGAILTGEQNQGMNVLGTTQAGAALSIALRGRLTASNAVTAMRGVSGASDVMSGSTVGTNTPGSGGGATGGYFNADIKPGGAIGSYAVLYGVAADAENTGAGTTANTNAFIGGRFGANNANFGAASAIGTLSQSGGSTTNNIGVLGSAGAAAADLGALAATIPVGSNTGLYGYVTTSVNGVNTSAIVANNATATGTALNVVSGGVRSSAAVGARFADNVAATAGTSTVITNSLVKATSTIVVSVESALGAGNVYISSKGAGTFTVNSSAGFVATDRIDYIIINP